MLGTFLRHG